ncbi:MAG: YfhO family protein [Bacteroidota bacterium]
MAKARKASVRKEQGSFFSSLSPTKQDALCILILYVVIVVLFRGIIFNDAAFSSEADTATAHAYKKAGDAIRDQEGIDPIWMPFVFSGMPSLGSLTYIPHDVSYLQVAVVSVLKLFFLNVTMGWMIVHYFLGGVFMFLLMRTWKLPRVAALFAALTFMLSPFAVGLAQEGHGSKMISLMYLPAVFLVTHMMLERRDWLSFGLFSSMIGTLLLANHMQIVYYNLMVIGLYMVYQAVVDFKEQKLLAGRKALMLAGGLLIGFCISSYIYLPVYEYSQFSIRGSGTAGTPGGLTWDYATNWSFHPFEMITYVIPSFFGFAGQLYWGTMPMNSSTVYIGILPIFLSIIALLYKRNRLTVFFAILAVLMFFTSFGKHFDLFYQLLFNYLPFFNKFRAPQMILQLMPFVLGVLGGYGLTALLESDAMKNTALKKRLLYVLGALWALLLIGTMFHSSLYETLSGFMFLKEGENYNPQEIATLKKLRFDLFWDDYIKMVMLATASLGATILYLNGKIRQGAFGAVVLCILTVDLFIMDTVLINPKPFKAVDENFQPTPTISFLKQQEGLFRVFPVGNLFMDMDYAYHGLTSIGGYHPAKLKMYQTMIDSCLFRGADPNFPLNMSIVNMLNARYVVAQGQLPPDKFEVVNVDQARRTVTHKNPTALPRAWFVKNTVVAHSGTGVFAKLNDPQFDPAQTAILESEPAGSVSAPDSSNINIVEHKSTTITIETYASSSALLVLSEVYYPAGWNVYVDGTPAIIHKTNYVLRSVVVPAGQHKVEFRFEPMMYALGWKLTNGAWVFCGICILIGLWRTPGIKNRILARKPAST